MDSGYRQNQNKVKNRRRKNKNQHVQKKGSIDQIISTKNNVVRIEKILTSRTKKENIIDKKINIDFE